MGIISALHYTAVSTVAKHPLRFSAKIYYFIQLNKRLHLPNIIAQIGKKLLGYSDLALENRNHINPEVLKFQIKTIGTILLLGKWCRRLNHLTESAPVGLLCHHILLPQYSWLSCMILLYSFTEI